MAEDIRLDIERVESTDIEIESMESQTLEMELEVENFEAPALRMDLMESDAPEIELEMEIQDAVATRQAEAWAVGKRGGVDVPSTDPTYHNNAKYYAEHAAEQAAESALRIIDPVDKRLTADMTAFEGVHNFLNYGYDTPANLAPNPSASDPTVYGVERNQEIVILNGGPTTGSLNGIRIKLNENVSRTYLANTVAGWTATVKLLTGHTYLFTLKLLSGSYTGGSNYPGLAILKSGESTSIGSYITRAENISQRVVDGDDGLYNVAIYIYYGTVFTNAKYLVTMEDVTDGYAWALYTPSVSSAGVISWTNNHALPNPESVDIAVAVRSAIVETVTGTTPSITGVDNHRYICGEVSTISITPPASGLIDVRFSSGSTPAVLTVPNTVKFPAWFDATSLEANVTYEMSFCDGYGAVMAWQT